jgi:hypothetical protein
MELYAGAFIVHRKSGKRYKVHGHDKENDTVICFEISELGRTAKIKSVFKYSEIEKEPPVGPMRFLF